MTDWITDRLPTAADADQDGDVTVQNRPKVKPSAGSYFHWELVVSGMAWCHTDIWEAPAKPAPAPKPALAVGQRWRRRDGKEVTITEHDTSRDDRFPFRADGHWSCGGGHWYRADGTSCINASHVELVELIEPAAEPEPVTTPRRFVSIRRTVSMDKGGNQYHTIDAVADDGTCWWMIPGETDWQQAPALPARTSND